jgi:hypothetical protein
VRWNFRMAEFVLLKNCAEASRSAIAGGTEDWR